MDNLTVGTKVNYKGDMANLPAKGEIIKVRSSDWYPVMYDIALDNGVEKRVAMGITPANFGGHSRFSVAA